MAVLPIVLCGFAALAYLLGGTIILMWGLSAPLRNRGKLADLDPRAEAALWYVIAAGMIAMAVKAWKLLRKPHHS